MLNPEQLHFDSVAFDTEKSSVVAEVTSNERGHSKLEVRIEDDTRVNGTLTHDDETADGCAIGKPVLDAEGHLLIG